MHHESRVIVCLPGFFFAITTTLAIETERLLIVLNIGMEIV